MIRRLVLAALICFSLAHAARAALSLDGTASGGSGSALTITTGTLTTTTGSGVIVCGGGTNATGITSVTAAGLTFTARSGTPAGPTSGPGFIYEYTAPYSSNFSGTITVLQSSTAYGQVYCAGIGGAPTSSFFDSNGSVPGISKTSTLASLSTSNANDFIIAFSGTSTSGTTTPGSGWSLIGTPTNFFMAEYQIVSSTQSGLAVSCGACSGGGASIIDALIQGAVSSPTRANFFHPGLR